MRPHPRYAALLAALLVLCTLGLVGPSAVSASSHHPRVRDGLVVRGDVTHRLRLSNAVLAEYDQQTVTATYGASGVPTTATFTGPLLLDVVQSASPRFDPAVKNDPLRYAVRASATDDYQAVVAWGEIDPGFEGKKVLLALTQDGTPLDRPRLVVPGDARGGRYVSDLTELVVRDLGR